MLIGFDAKRIFYNKSGLGNYGRNLLNNLQLYFPDNDYFLFSPKRKNPLFNYEYKNITIIEPKLNFLWRSKRILNNAYFKKLDIYHGLSAELPFGISKTKVKSVVTIHDLIFLRHPELYKNIDRKIYKTKAQKACDEANKIIAISEQTKNDICELLKVDDNKIKIVYQSCNEIFKYKTTNEDFKLVKEKYNLPNEFILNVGTIEPRKNAFLIVKAIFEFKIDFPLVIIGKETEYSKQIRNYIIEKNLNNKVFIIDRVDTKDLPVIYQNAKLFIYPSQYEGFGIPIIEAFTSNTPVITSDISVFREVANDSAVYTKLNDSENIGNEIKKLLNDSEYYESIKMKGKKRAEYFDGKKISNEIMHLYKNL